MKNSKVYCQISVYSCFVIILKSYIFLFHFEFSGGHPRYVMAGSCFTDVMQHSSKNYHQEHATETRWPQVTPSWPRGAL